MSDAGSDRHRLEAKRIMAVEVANIITSIILDTMSFFSNAPLDEHSIPMLGFANIDASKPMHAPQEGHLSAAPSFAIDMGSYCRRLTLERSLLQELRR